MNVNIHIAKTEAEVGFAEAFDTHHETLPGGDDIAKLRDDAMAQFVATGLPSKRVEEYKYTDLRAFLSSAIPLTARDEADISEDEIKAVRGALADLDAHTMMFVNGTCQLGKSEGGNAEPLSRALTGNADWVQAQFSEQKKGNDTAVVALNTALMQDGYSLQISDNGDKPHHMVFQSCGKDASTSVYRNVIRVAKGCQATIIETHMSDDAGHQVNTQTDVILEDDATLNFVKIVTCGTNGNHLGTVRVIANENTNFQGFQMTVGGNVSRNQVYATYAGEHATVDYSGVFLGRGKEHSDTTMIIDHAVPHGTSRELFKTVLDDEARGVFQGKVIVQQYAQKTDGKQMSQALLLSNTAEFDSKPELEIFADDVVCGHGATSGQIDDEHLFYLRARGIPEARARAMLVQAFVAEAFEQLDNEQIEDALTALTAEWFEAA